MLPPDRNLQQNFFISEFAKANRDFALVNSKIYVSSQRGFEPMKSTLNMKPEIKSFHPEDEYYFKEGCHIIEVSNSNNDEHLSIARARVEPQHTTAWHQLKNTVERYVILEGTGKVEIGGLHPAMVSAGDVVVIPQQTKQRIQNTGERDLIFLAICSPRFNSDNYQALQ
jgi:mannose-6-phosphate isomerase-like protein (cupin superfamily)|tara:strand:+ start:4466 stop:4972 length:507 start_codon:yes stop_codon:yes gene_type:complete